MRGTSLLLSSKYFRPKTDFTDKEHEVKFKTQKPLKVGNSVTTSITRSSDRLCIQELFNMMACLKTHDFEQANCLKELRLFNECNGSQRPVVFRVDKNKDQTHLKAQPGQTDLSTHQLNDYLKKFPT